MSSSVNTSVSTGTNDSLSELVELNVGGTSFTTTVALLTSVEGSRLAQWFAKGAAKTLLRDSQHRFFIDRDGELFRLVLDALRARRDQQQMLEDQFNVLSTKQHRDDTLNDFEGDPDSVIPFAAVAPTTADRISMQRYVRELEYYGVRDALLPSYAQTTERLHTAAPTGSYGHITVSYHGTFNFGRQGVPAADVSFRKISRIIVCGRVSLCREVFGDTLNEGRDPDRGQSEDRYTARFFLKHTFLEQAFDALARANFRMTASVASGTNGPIYDTKGAAGTANTEEDRWLHYNEFVFVR